MISICRQFNFENGTGIRDGLHAQLPAVRFHDIVAQAQAQSRSLSGRLGGEDGLQDFTFHILVD